MMKTEESRPFYREAFSIFLITILLSQAFYPKLPVYAANGNLIVTVYNIGGAPAYSLGGTTRVILYDASYSYLGTQVINSNSQASWSNLTTGDYYIEVYHEPTGTPNLGGEYWGNNRVTVSSGTTNFPFTRHAPYLSDIHASPTTVNVGQTVMIYVTVTNPETSSKSCYVRMLLYKGTLSCVFDQNSQSFSISGGGSRQFSFSYTPTEAGTYYHFAGVYTTYSTTTLTDQWAQSSSFTVTYSYTVSISGLTSGSTTVYLDGSAKTTLSNGQSYTFSGLSGSHKISVDSPIDIGSTVRYVCVPKEITVSNQGSYTFSYTKLYWLTMQANPPNGGTVSPSSGWYPADQPWTISASPASGWTFQSWTGSGTGSYSGPNNPATITINGPITETANFQPMPSLSVQVSANPSSITTSQSSTITVTVTSGGSTVSGASVSLSCSPSGPSLNPSSGTTGSDGRFTATFSSSATGTFTITATASKSGYNSGSGSTQITVSQTPPPFDFSISVSPSSRTVTAGQSTTYSVTVSLVSGTAQTVSLSLSGQHSTMSYSFNPSSGSPTFTSTLTVSTTSSTPAQTYTLTVTGTGGGITRQQQVTLIVQPSPTLPTEPQNLVATAGDGRVTLSWSAPRSDGGSAITNYRIYRRTSSTSQSLIATVDNVLSYTDTSVTNGVTYYYQVSAVNSVGEGPKSNEASATPTSTPQPDFSISASPNSLSLTLSSSGLTSATSTVRVTSINGFSSQVSLSASWVGTTPSGVTCSFNKNTVTPPSNGQDSSILTITASSSASTGSFTLRVTGTSGSLTRTVDIAITISPPQQKYLMVSVSAVSYQLNSEESTTIRATVTVSDGGSPSITYSWNANGGALSSTSGNPVIWTAPRVTSQTTYRITVSVSASGYIGASGYVDITVKPVSIQRGTLVVYIYNVNDKLANYMSGKTDVYLTGDGGAFSATMNSQGYTTFSDIPVGTYRLSVFHKPQETGALNLDEYWGTENVQVNQGYNERKFVRSAPWVIDYSVKVDGKEIARPGFMSQETIDVGSTVDFQISVKNSGSSSVNTRVRLIIDADQISPFDYDQTSSWKTTSPSSPAIHQFTASFVAGSQFHEIAPTYSAYIVVISTYDNKEYVTDQYVWTEFVSFKIQFSSEKANIIMQLASEVIDIVFKQNKAVVEETLRKIVQGETVGGISITISPSTIEKVSGRTGLVSGIVIPLAFKTAELAFIVNDNGMSYEKKLDALAEVVAKIVVATATRIALLLAIKGMVSAAAITVEVPPASLMFTGAAFVTYLGQGFFSDLVADYVVSKNWGDIKGKARSFLEGFQEFLFPILNKDAVSFSAHCPIYISVRDTRGRITGMIFSDGKYSVLEEIPGSRFFNDSGHQTIWIAFPEPDNYEIVVNGSDRGEYTIMVTSFVDSEVFRNETISGKIEKGEMSVLSVKLDDGVTPKIGPLIRSIFIDTIVAIGDPLTISLEVSGKGVIEVSAILRDSNNVNRSSILMKQGSIYRASIDTSGMEKGAAVLTLVAKDSDLSTAASFIVMLLGRMQIKIQQYKSEVSSGERLELKLLVTDHNDNPVDSADVHIILAGNNYVAQNTASGFYSAVLDTAQLEGSYTVYINASKPLYRNTETSLALMVRPWWWPYLPYAMVIAAVAVISTVVYEVYRSSRKKDKPVFISEELLIVLKEAGEHLRRGDYAKAVKYSAETLRGRLLDKLGLSKSLTIDELVANVAELRKDMDSEKLRYVLRKGEECTFARYKPNKEEAEKVLKYSEELLKEL
jgi:hypothetical protein